MREINLPQSCQRWLDWRAGLFNADGTTNAEPILTATASEAATILDLSPYDTPYNLGMEKLGILKRRDISRNPNVRRGNRLEPYIRQLAAKALKTSIRVTCAEHDTLRWCRVSFDGLTPANEPVELKAPSESYMDEIVDIGRESTAFKLYYPQVQMQMYVSGAKKGYLVFYAEQSKRLRIFPIKANALFQADMISKCTEFLSNLEKGALPAPNKQKDIFVPDDKDMAQWNGSVARLLELHDEIEELKERLEEVKGESDGIEGHLIRLSGGFKRVLYRGVQITLVERKGSLNNAKFIKDQKLVVPDSYRGSPTAYHKVTIVDRKEVELISATLSERLVSTLSQGNGMSFI